MIKNIRSLFNLDKTRRQDETDQRNQYRGETKLCETEEERKL